MNTPLVSVIIPNYNHARFLEERIQSVLGQTYQDFELIILDDCSPDDGASKRIIEAYRDNPHVSHIVYNETNSGSAFKQWHKGFELAKGKYVWIAESDDSCKETFLETLVDKSERHDTVLTFSKSLKCDEYGNSIPWNFQDVLAGSFVMEGKDFIKKHMCGKNVVANASSALILRQSAMSLNRQYTKMRAEGDWLFWIELAERGRVYYVNEKLNYFRSHSLNTTKDSMRKGINHLEHLTVYNYLTRGNYLVGLKKEQHRIIFVHVLTLLTFENKEKILRMWDRNGIYRKVYPLYTSVYWLYSRLKELKLL